LLLYVAEGKSCSGSVVKEWCLYVSSYSTIDRFNCNSTELWSFSCR